MLVFFSKISALPPELPKMIKQLYFWLSKIWLNKRRTTWENISAKEEKNDPNKITLKCKKYSKERQSVNSVPVKICSEKCIKSTGEQHAFSSNFYKVGLFNSNSYFVCLLYLTFICMLLDTALKKEKLLPAGNINSKNLCKFITGTWYFLSKISKVCNMSLFVLNFKINSRLLFMGQQQF